MSVFRVEHEGGAMGMRVVVGVVLVAGVVALGWALMPRGGVVTPPPASGSASEPAAESIAEPVATPGVREAFAPGRLLVGDPAPALSISKWFIGEPRQSLAPGYVHVVDLWATWCGPCIRAMPELTALQAEHHAEGLRVLGVSIDEAKNAEEQVARFIENRRETIGFDIALDDGRTVQDWLTAAGRSSIPTSYVVDQEGTLAWIGHPQEPGTQGGATRMEEVVVALLEGTFDLEEATEEARKVIEGERQAEAEAGRVRTLMDEMSAAWGAGDREKTIEIIDRIIELDPKAGAELAVRKAEILLYELRRTEDATAFVSAMIEGAYAEDAETLLRFSSLLSGELDPGPEGREAAVRAARKAVELSGDNPSLLAQLGHAQFTAGDVDGAVETMVKARDLCEEGDGMYEVLDELVVQYQREGD